MAGCRYRASVGSLIVIRSRDGLAWTLIKSEHADASLTVQDEGLSSGSVILLPPSKLRRARMSCAR